MRIAEEEFRGGEIPIWSHLEWMERFPWLVQGTTGGPAAGADPAGEAVDFGLFGTTPVGEAIARWSRLRDVLRVDHAVHSRQVHGARSVGWNDSGPAGLTVVDGYDAHFTRLSGVLLTTSVADCVPIFLVCERPRVVAIAHAGWRGVAGGVLESALEAMRREGAADVELHCGPSICGQCYEVGPEVHEALFPDARPAGKPEPVDLTRAIEWRARGAGLSPTKLTRSMHCTRCGPGTFFSHRAGSRGRQLGVIAIGDESLGRR